MNAKKISIFLFIAMLSIAVSSVWAQFTVTVTDQTTTAPLANRWWGVPPGSLREVLRESHSQRHLPQRQLPRYWLGAPFPRAPVARRSQKSRSPRDRREPRKQHFQSFRRERIGSCRWWSTPSARRHRESLFRPGTCRSYSRLAGRFREGESDENWPLQAWDDRPLPPIAQGPGAAVAVRPVRLLPGPWVREALQPETEGGRCPGHCAP